MAVFGLAIAERLTALGHDVELVVSAVRGYHGPARVVPVTPWSRVYLWLLGRLAAAGVISERRKRYLEEVAFDRLCRSRVVDGLDLVVSTNSFAPRTLGRARDGGVPVVLVPGNPNDVVLGAMTSELARRHGIHVEDAYTDPARRELYRTTVAAASLVLCYSRVIDRSFADLVPAARRRVHPALLKFKPLAAESRYPDRIVFGYLGYSVLLKGLDVLLAAWERIHQSTDARLVVGGGIDASVRPIVDKYQRDRGRYRIDFTGPVDDAGRFFGGCSVGVVPSLLDGQPAVAVEAMALARPVIVTDGCGVADFVADRESGRVVPAGDVDALADAMQWFIDARDRIPACGRRARAAYDAFDFSAYTSAVVDDILDHAAVRPSAHVS